MFSRKDNASTIDGISPFEEEVYRKAQNMARQGRLMGFGGVAIGAVSVMALLAAMPLKSTEPYVLVVDKTTGQTERAVAVDNMEFDGDEAIIQANLASYVIDRETYDPYDNGSRTDRVLNLSAEQAEDDYRAIWASDNASHPDVIYGENVRIRVAIRSVTILNAREQIAQVEVGFTRKENGSRDVSVFGVATIQYAFDPQSNSRVEDVWQNPLGFQVTSYRMDIKNQG